METKDILSLQAYVDGELSPGELRRMEGLISRDCEARGLVEQVRLSRAMIRANEPEVACPETREFYWSQIARQIERTDRGASESHSLIPNWVWRYLSPVAGVAALAALLIAVNREAIFQETAESGEEGLPEASSVVFRSQAEGMTVVWLQSADDSVFTPLHSEDNL